jgi:hypothetical protein
MKKRLLMVLMIGAVVAAGIVAGRVRANRNTKRATWPAVTIISQITEFGSKRKVFSRTTMVRRQHVDGRWEQDINDRGNGKPFTSRGQVDLSTVPTVEQYELAAVDFDRREDQMLGYRVLCKRMTEGNSGIRRNWTPYSKQLVQ